jgi:dephospho-CoA kinase
MLRIAVTGGIACGKSRMALYLQSCSISVCDADDLAHAAFEPGTEVYYRVIDEFGAGIVDDKGIIDRKKLADIVFSDSSKLAELNKLVHPVVEHEISKWINVREQAGDKIAVVVIPLLFEAGMDGGWDAVVCVGCPPDLQQKRVMARGINVNECRRRIDAQMSIAEKMERSDFVIWNDGSEILFERKIDDVLKRIQEKTR